jgi:O-antigen/teichoic acid export membrane protein
MIKISRSFIKGSLIYTLIGALPMASAVLLLPFYLAGLSATDFGALSIYLAFALLMQLLVTYSFDSSLYIHYHEFKSHTRKLSSFISSAFVLMLIIAVVLFGLLLFTGEFFFELIFNDKPISFYPYGWLALGGGIFQSLFKVHSNLLQSREKPETFFWANLFLFSGIVLFTIIGLHIYPNTLLGPLGGRLLALSLASIWVLFRIFREFGFHFDFNLLSTSFSFNFYAFIYQLQQWVINYFDRFLMLFYVPLVSVGVYDFAIKCLIGIELFMNGLHSSFYPKVVKEVMAQETKGTTFNINRYYNGFVAVMMLAVSASIFVVPFIIDWLADYYSKPDYKGSIELIPYIAVLYLFKSVRIFLGFPYGILKYTKPLPVIYFVAAAVKIVGMLLLIKDFEIMGVIIASMLSLLVEMLLLHFQLRGKFMFQFNAYKIVIAPLLLLLFILFVELLIPFSSEMVKHFSYCLICFLLLLFTYRNEVKLIDPFRIIK